MGERLLNAVQDGTPVTYAATAAGIGPATFHRWMARGEGEQARVDAGGAPDPAEAPYRLLWEQVTQARAAVACANAAVVRRVAEGGYVVKERRYRDSATGEIVTETDYAPPDWRAASWMLERSFRREFGRPAVEVSGPDGGPVSVEHAVPPEVADIARRLQELAEQQHTYALPGAGPVIDGEVIHANGNHANGRSNGRAP